MLTKRNLSATQKIPLELAHRYSGLVYWLLVGLQQCTNSLILFLSFCITADSLVFGAEPPNVLFIVIDDLRPELNCYGIEGVQTPNIDRLSEKGVRFNRAYCQYPVCNPSRCSFLTGLRPDELGIVTNKVALRKKWPDIVTLPELYRRNGYFTAGLGKIFHQGLDDQGKLTLFRDVISFEHSYKALGNSPSVGRRGDGRLLGDGSIPWCRWLAAEGGDEAQPDGMIANEAVRVLEENRDKPFFISVGFHKPHDPFFAPKEYFHRYPIDEVELAVIPEDRVLFSRHALPKSYDFSKFSEQDRREFKRAYQACVSFVDAQVGKLFETMDRLALWEDTIVVLMGDHGYHLGEHGWWNKVTVFELGARGPLMIWIPDSEGMGRECESVVEFLDLYPTLIDYCDLEPPHQLSGKSLRPLLQDPSLDWKRAAYTQVTRGGVGMGYSVRFDHWRFTQWGIEGQGGCELYDHSVDALEYYNLADTSESVEIQKKLKALLRKGFPAVR